MLARLKPAFVFPARSSPQPSVRSLVLLAAGVILIHVAFLKPAVWGLDGNEVLQVAYSLITEQNFHVTPAAGGVVGIDGQSYSTRYLLLPLLLTPLVAIAHFLSGLTSSLTTLQIAPLIALTSSVALTAATTVMVVLLALRLGAAPQSAYISALCYAFGTIALTYAQTLFSEPLLGFITITCLYLAFGPSRRDWLFCSVLATLAILAKPTGIVIAPILSLYFLAKRYSLSTVLAPILLPALGVVGYGLYNYARFGDLFDTGQPTHYAWSAVGLWERFFGFMFGLGMGGGLFWYCPPVILALVGLYKVCKSRPLEALTIAGVFFSFSFLYAHWWCCGWDWGPRFLVPVLPVLMALTAQLDYAGRRVLIGLSVAGFIISAPTLVSFYQRYYWEVEASGADVWSLSLWTHFADSPLLNVWSATYRQIRVAMTTDVNAVLAAGELAGLTQIVPTWWWMLPIIGIPVWIGAIAAVGLVVAGIVALIRGWRELQVATN